MRRVLWQQLFLHFGADDFPFKNLFKKCFKIDIFPLGRGAGFGAAICVAVVRNSIVCFATQSLQIAMGWLRPGSWLLQLRAEYFYKMSFASWES